MTCENLVQYTSNLNAKLLEAVSEDIEFCGNTSQFSKTVNCSFNGYELFFKKM